MSWGLVAVAGATLVGGVMSSNAQRKAGDRAADAQSAAAELGIEEQRRQFDAIQKLLDPYVRAGQPALTGQQDLLGLNGSGAQGTAIAGIQNSPQFAALLAQGENSILQNASATGGLRGGNTQAALAHFSPALLAQLIDDRYSKLGGMVTLGQNSAVGVGNAGLQVGTNVTNLLGQQGAARAGGYLNQGRQTANMWNSLSQAVGTLGGGWNTWANSGRGLGGGL